MGEEIALFERGGEGRVKAGRPKKQSLDHNEVHDWEPGLDLNRQSVKMAQELAGLATPEIEMNARANAGARLGPEGPCAGG